VPLLKRAIYLENKRKVGLVDDVFGQISSPGIAIQPEEGVNPESFKDGDKVGHPIEQDFSSTLTRSKQEKLISLYQSQRAQE